MNRMRKTGLFAAIAMALQPLVGGAQLAVSVELEHRIMIKHDSAYVTLTVSNESDIPFVIESDKEDPKARVLLLIDRGQDRMAPRVGDAPLVTSLALLPGEDQQLRINMARFYDIAASQNYRLTGVVEWNGKQYRSAQLSFDIVNGLPVGEVVRGLPGNSERLRRYELRYLTRERTERLFLCVDEDDGLVSCGVFDLGPVVRVFRPRLAVDRFGTVTVTHQRANGRYVSSTLLSLPDRVTLVSQVEEGGPDESKNAPKESVVDKRGVPSNAAPDKVVVD